MIYGFENCELDLGAHELRRAGGVQAVEPRVFKLLGYLVENSHRMISKDEILAHVWEGRVVSDLALSSQIKAARKAIGDDGKAQNSYARSMAKAFVLSVAFGSLRNRVMDVRMSRSSIRKPKGFARTFASARRRMASE